MFALHQERRRRVARLLHQREHRPGAGDGRGHGQEPASTSCGGRRLGMPQEGPARAARYRLEFDVDPHQYPYEVAGARASQVNVTDLRMTRVRCRGRPVGFVMTRLDPETNTMQVTQSQVLDPHGRKGLGNWMYRSWRSRPVPVQSDQSPRRRLWAQPDRPFGPQDRTSSTKYRTAHGSGHVDPVGPPDADRASLTQTGRLTPRVRIWSRARCRGCA